MARITPKSGISAIAIMVAAALFILAAIVQNKPQIIKQIDIEIPVPAPGTDLLDALEVNATKAITEYGDLAQGGDIQIMELDYIGDFEQKRDGSLLFKAGCEYKVECRVIINQYGKYQTDFFFRDNEYVIDESRIRITVNGVEAKVHPSAPYGIRIETMVTI